MKQYSIISFLLLLLAVTTGYGQDKNKPTASPEHIEALRTGNYELVNLEPQGKLRKVVFRKPPSNTSNSSLMLFPNPATKEMRIKLSDVVLTNHYIDVYNQNGQKQFSQAYTTDRIDISSLPAGTYVVCVSNGKQTSSQTLIVTK